jgi:hypothetical protein
MFIGPLSPVSNKADWSDSIELTDDTTGALIDISGATAITLEVQDPQTGGAVLTASLGSGITLISTGVFQWSFTAAQMSNLPEKTYDVGVLITMNSQTTQLVIGQLPVLDGVVG